MVPLQEGAVHSLESTQRFPRQQRKPVSFRALSRPDSLVGARGLAWLALNTGLIAVACDFPKPKRGADGLSANEDAIKPVKSDFSGAWEIWTRNWIRAALRYLFLAISNKRWVLWLHNQACNAEATVYAPSTGHFYFSGHAVA